MAQREAYRCMELELFWGTWRIGFEETWLADAGEGPRSQVYEESLHQTDFWLLGCPESLSTMIYVKASVDVGERRAWSRPECGKSRRGWSLDHCRLVIDPGSRNVYSGSELPRPFSSIRRARCSPRTPSPSIRSVVADSPASGAVLGKTVDRPSSDYPETRLIPCSYCAMSCWRERWCLVRHQVLVRLPCHWHRGQGWLKWFSPNFCASP